MPGFFLLLASSCWRAASPVAVESEPSPSLACMVTALSGTTEEDIEEDDLAGVVLLDERSASLCFFDCAARLSLKSFCFLSKGSALFGWTSESAGARCRNWALLKGRVRVEEGVEVATRVTARLENMLGGYQGSQCRRAVEGWKLGEQRLVVKDVVEV